MKVGRNEAALDVHAILGVSHAASPDEIRRAYKRLASRLHPDRIADPADRAAAERRMKDVNVAAAILLDPAKYAQYLALRAGRSVPITNARANASAEQAARAGAWPFSPMPNRGHAESATAAAYPRWARAIERTGDFLRPRPWMPFVLAMSATLLFAVAAQAIEGPIPVASSRYEIAPTPHFKTVYER